MDKSLVQVKGPVEYQADKTCRKENLSIECPFYCLLGEIPSYYGKGTEGCVVITNFRFFAELRNGYINLPLGLIESLETKEILHLLILCKDACSYRVTFDLAEACSEVNKNLTRLIGPSKKLEDIFAYKFFLYNQEEPRDDIHKVLDYYAGDYPNVDGMMILTQEVKRNAFDTKGAWRITTANEKYALCPTYPRQLLIPACITDDKLESVARFRSSRRFPAVVWRHSGNGAVIARCSQPEVGWLGWRSSEDEDLIRAIAEACASDCGRTRPLSGSNDYHSSSFDSYVNVQQNKVQKVLIVDARSYTTAFANRARGGGCECPEYYPNCEIVFMNLANIHSIRKSFHSLRQLCSMSNDQSSWLSLLEGTKWLQHMSGLLRSSLTVMYAIHHEGRPVVVHCSDGWDRTPQIVALAELLLDPYYRTFEGFQVLIEREWLEFGHKFSDRCGQGLYDDDPNERCPVFLQWLDCVHQLIMQFPCAFEFNVTLLEKLVQHTYSNLFVTFLFNCSQQREKSLTSYSVWLYFKANASNFKNYLYMKEEKPLEPSFMVKDLRFWSAVYMPLDGAISRPLNQFSPSNKIPLEDSELGEDEDDEKAKTRSCEDLNGHADEAVHSDLKVRRNSQPSFDFSESMNPVMATVGVHMMVNHSCDNSEDNSDEVIFSNGTCLDEDDNECVKQLPCHEIFKKPSGPVINSYCDKVWKDPTSVESSTDTLVAEVGTDECNLADIKNVESDHSCSVTAKFSHCYLTHDELHHALPVLSEVPSVYNNVNGCLPALTEDMNVKCSICIANRKLLSEKEIYDSNCIKRQISNGSGTMSHNSTPTHSRMPSSGCSIILDEQNSDVKNATIKYFFDLDGLSTPTNDIQKCVKQVLESRDEEVHVLKEKIGQLRTALTQQVLHKCINSDNSEDQNSLPESNCSGEHCSINSECSVSDRSSYVMVEEDDVNHTLWEPDHLATICTSCSNQFWAGRRKHHCRKCGKIFCGNCSSVRTPLPEEQLYGPVRVCQECYNTVNNTCRQSILESRTNSKSGVVTTASS